MLGWERHRAPGRKGTGGKRRGLSFVLLRRGGTTCPSVVSKKPLVSSRSFCIAQSTKIGEEGQPGQSLCPGVNTGPLTGISSKTFIRKLSMANWLQEGKE